jgi:hypothetical protein
MRVARKSDLAQADRYEAWARIVGWEAIELGDLRVNQGDPGLAVAPDSAYIYGIQVFRRLTPWDILAPELLHLSLR